MFHGGDKSLLHGFLSRALLAAECGDNILIIGDDMERYIQSDIGWHGNRAFLTSAGVP